ncbi:MULTISPECIES: ScbR family autoregulator-binding transcription factor [Streptomyces]|uniref:Transcriptional regulator, TetR family n=1 Tax=Streptomyces pini TaxID=1520580 RepID=A0A1I3ZK11_9ACTN|nr:ScbR family autoregulator-binding transcription factor [Streptomyces pini]SFK44418.1 transcriptional regulator, TetR family [Streptomyces pini]
MTGTHRPQTARDAARHGPALKQERAFQTRALILDKAAELFSESNYRSVSMQDVADRVGMTKGAVYFHFRSKEALAAAVVACHYERWPPVVEEIRNGGLSPLEAVEELLDRAALAFRDDPIMQAGTQLQLDRDTINAELPAPYVYWTNLLTDLLDAARAENQLRTGVRPDSAARALVAAFFGIQHISHTLTRHGDIVGRWQELRELFFHSLRA